ncbi:MAG: CRISPR-associated helicase Cas3', partial [Candidatus Hermodarchaeota archaeon]
MNDMPRNHNNKIKMFYYIWGKSDPFHPLIYHMIDVGCMVKAMTSSAVFSPIVNKLRRLMSFPDDKSFQNWISYLVALHDIGKCSPDFQTKGHIEVVQELENFGLSFRDNPAPKFYHNILSAEWVFDWLLDKSWNRKAAAVIKTAILGHHGYFIADHWEEEENLETIWDPIRNQLHEELISIFTPPLWVRETAFEHANPVGVLLLGLIVLADWIASNNALFEYDSLVTSESEKKHSLLEYSKRSERHAQACIEKMGFDWVYHWTQNAAFLDIWPAFTTLFPIQEAVEKVTTSLQTDNEIIDYKFTIIEATMGEGKTEAALYLATQLISAFKLSGIYIALPTMATSNQMYHRIKKFLQTQDSTSELAVKLVHGMAWIIDENTPQLETFTTITHIEKNDLIAIYEWFKPVKRGLLSTYAVGTIDQALLSVLHVRFGFLRLIGLSNKVLIIDEVHAYDAYMNHILKRLLEWANVLDIPVILLSATLPSIKKTELVRSYLLAKNGTKRSQSLSSMVEQTDYPLITLVSKTGSIKYQHIDRKSTLSGKEILLTFTWNVRDNLETFTSRIIESAGQQCVCVILNTIKNAQMIYKIIEQKLQQRNLEIKLILFHARFPINQRNKIENTVIKLFGKEEQPNPKNREFKTNRPRSAILIATQIVEQSLDLDFDEMYSEIAPLDLLIQRMGRLHRHVHPRALHTKPRFHIVSLSTTEYSFGTTERIYSKYILIKTAYLLEQKSSLVFPAD